MEMVAGLAMPASTSKLMVCSCSGRNVQAVRGLGLGLRGGVVGRRWVGVVEGRGRRGVVVMQAGEGKKGSEVVPGEESDLDDKILPYCDIKGKGGKKTLGEMEQEFLEALQSFYFDSTPIMSNEEFDNLKEELTWEGSSVVILSSDEQRFLEASLSYAAGKPILNDQEFDNLKMKLKMKGSKVAIAGPRCSLRSKKVVSDATVDYLKMTALNLPAALIALGLVFFLDDITGFEITYLLELPEPYSFLFTWFIVLPVTFLIAQSITNLVLKDALILTGPCPNCGRGTNSYFGSILTIPSAGKENTVKCEGCSSNMIFNVETRLITLDDSPPSAPKKPVRTPKPASEKVSTSA
ncbi:hypothetical protein KC19_1G205300 [Ceratodon purpureus]|uniref:PGR5-like protein 1A, chloroplastic n=1 Tax=Ceratodon purpureus TaxID=3225 RepID=A0A8T0JA49_CERPU|nr:hypothetical protein KC19_1G205300 [Ceratodon purpureus]